MREGTHSFECWGAASKLHKHKFNTTDRGVVLTGLGLKWRKILEKDLREAAKKCSTCIEARKRRAKK